MTEEQNTEDFKQNEDFTEENNSRRETKIISEDRLQLIIEKITPDWEKLGTKLGKVKFPVWSSNCRINSDFNYRL